MKHYQVHFQPDNKSVRVHHGATLLEAAGLVGIILSNPCGGVGRCGKCKVRLLPGEKEVLACQYVVEHDVEVVIPDTSRYFKQQILEHGITQALLSDAAVRKVLIAEPPSDLDQLCRTVSEELQTTCVPDKAFADRIATQLDSDSDFPITAIVRQDTPKTPETWQLIGIEAGDTTESLFGLAVDIGTTSVVARLMNLHTSEPLATVSQGNPQAQHGADVISRIQCAETDNGALKLQQTIVACLNDLIEQAAKQAGIAPNAIYEIVVASNTTMNHLLLGYPVKQLGQSPYMAHSTAAANTPSQQLGLTINPCGNVHTIANIAGFVGSDTVAAALACAMDVCKVPTLLVDIGTNGELVFCYNKQLLAASCAAGPALEGAGIEFGSRAQDGAIERVVQSETDIDIDVIGDIEAASICGSGLIDAVAVLLELELIDGTGRFAIAEEIDPFLSKQIRQRIITHNDEPAFVLSGQYTDHTWHNKVLITQKDVRQFQLAKAAIRAGITLLLKTAGQSEENIQQVLLAGAFGNYIQRESAVRVGLLPNLPIEKIHFVGNAAGSGAQMVLAGRSARQLANELATKIEYLEIAHQTEFQLIFSECLLFHEK